MGASALWDDMSYRAFKAPRDVGFRTARPRTWGIKSLQVTNYIIVDGWSLLIVNSPCVRMVFEG